MTVVAQINIEEYILLAKVIGISNTVLLFMNYKLFVQSRVNQKICRTVNVLKKPIYLYFGIKKN